MTETSDHEHLHQYSPGHEHPTQPDQDDTMTYFKVMEAAVRDLLIEKDLITAEQIREKIEQMDARVPANGAKIIAKSWVDEEFKRKLIANPRKAISEFGHDIGPLHLIVLENTEKVHNVVVCTLCSGRTRPSSRLAATRPAAGGFVRLQPPGPGVAPRAGRHAREQHGEDADDDGARHRRAPLVLAAAAGRGPPATRRW